MSRPFSYNDENFTVIGNILFCHFKLTEDLVENSNIVEIPPEIYKRMLFKSNQFMFVGDKDDSALVYWFGVGTRKSSSDEKYYLYTSSNIGISVNSYLYGYFVLKDI